MSTSTPTPWRVFTTTDGRKLVGIGADDGQGILDCGFGVWAWNDAEGIANADLVVKAVNNHDALVRCLEGIRDQRWNEDADLDDICNTAEQALRALVAGPKAGKP
jgi:hypothetical protein